MSTLAHNVALASEERRINRSDEIINLGIEKSKRIIEKVNNFWQPTMGQSMVIRRVQVDKHQQNPNPKLKPSSKEDLSRLIEELSNSEKVLQTVMDKNKELKDRNVLLLRANNVLNKRKESLIKGKDAPKEKDVQDEGVKQQHSQSAKSSKSNNPLVMKLELKRNNNKIKKLNHHNENLERHNKKLERENGLLWGEIFLLKTQPEYNLNYIKQNAKGR